MEHVYDLIDCKSPVNHDNVLAISFLLVRFTFEVRVATSINHATEFLIEPIILVSSITHIDNCFLNTELIHQLCNVVKFLLEVLLLDLFGINDFKAVIIGWSN